MSDISSDKTFTICAYAGVPEKLSVQKQYAILKACNINTVICGEEDITPYLNIAEMYGVKILSCNKDIQSAVYKYGENGGAAYFDGIMSAVKKYSQSKAYAGEIIKADLQKNITEGIRAFTDLYNKQTNGRICAATISQNDFEYTEEFIENAAPQLLITEAIGYKDITENCFYKLDKIRIKTAEKNLPFLAGIDIGFEAKNPLSVRAYARWQAFIALVFGAKGIYYGSIYGSGGDKGAITINGEKTALYEYLTELNKDLLKSGEILLNAKCGGVIAEEVNLYKEPLKEYYPVHFIKGENYIAGCFDGEKGSKKLLVTNLLPNSNANAVLTVNKGVALANVCIGTSSFTISPRGGEISVNINAGDAVLIEFNNAV